MKTKYILFSSIASLALSHSSEAQETHSAFSNLTKKIDLSADHVSMTKVDGDIGAITQYLDLIFETARKNGEALPDGLNAKDLFHIIGLDKLKTMGKSAKEIDNAWINHSYLETRGNNTGIFSLLGKANQEPVAASFLPSETDIAIQLQLDLKQLIPMILDIGKLGGKESTKADLQKVIPEIGMSPIELISKIDATVSIGLDINTDESGRKHPLSVLSDANAIIRVDGLTWLWDKVSDQVMANAKAPMDKSVNPDTGIITYTISKDIQTKMMGYLPQIIIDNKNDQIWITSKASFYELCLKKDNKLIDSAQYKAAMEKLPNTANSMLYLSKNTLLTAQAQYEFAANNNMFGAKFEEGKEIVNRLMEDITESDKGWAMVLTKDDHGLLLASRGPAGVHHLGYLTGAVAASSSLFYTQLSSRNKTIEDAHEKAKLQDSDPR